MNMMNTNYNDSVKEDSVQGLVKLSYRHKIKNFGFDLGYRGALGKNVKNHTLHAGLQLTF